MTFQFKPWANPVVSDFAYEMPPIPCGVSLPLNRLIETYADSVRGMEVGSEEDAFEAITSFTAKNISDVIAKFVIQLHHDFSGLDGETLVLAATEASHGAILSVQRLLADLYSQLPPDWDSALRAYRAKLLAEHDYDDRVWSPGYEASLAGGKGNTQAVEMEMERLQEERLNAEAFLLDMPAPSLAEFAIKYLICFDNDRDDSGCHTALCAEAKRLLQIDSDIEGREAAIILGNINVLNVHTAELAGYLSNQKGGR